MLPESLSAEDLARLPIFPLPEATLFPGAMLPLHVFEPRYRELVKDALAGRRILAVARLKPGYELTYTERPPVFEMCGAGVIVDHLLYPDGRYHITLRGLARVRILSELAPDLSYREVRGEVVADTPTNLALSAALERQIASLWATLGPELPEAWRDLAEVTRGATCAGSYADRLAGALAGDADTSQALLGEADPCERLRRIAERIQALTDSLVPAARRTKADWN